MATNYFYAFGDDATDILSDAQYSASTTRTGGVQTGIAYSNFHNKLYRQSSVMAAAWGEILKNAGYDASDSNFSDLVTNLTTITSNANIHGIPSSGTTGQFLKKNSSTDYDVVWATITIPTKTSDLTNDSNFVISSNVHNIPSGGVGAQVLVKSSSTDYDVAWGPNSISYGFEQCRIESPIDYRYYGEYPIGTDEFVALADTSSFSLGTTTRSVLSISLEDAEDTTATMILSITGATTQTGSISNSFRGLSGTLYLPKEFFDGISCKLPNVTVDTETSITTLGGTINTSSSTIQVDGTEVMKPTADGTNIYIHKNSDGTGYMIIDIARTTAEGASTLTLESHIYNAIVKVEGITPAYIS